MYFIVSSYEGIVCTAVFGVKWASGDGKRPRRYVPPFEQARITMTERV
jgi:hypothetical protein